MSQVAYFYLQDMNLFILTRYVPNSITKNNSIYIRHLLIQLLGLVVTFADLRIILQR